jgi:hypothetical protein
MPGMDEQQRRLGPGVWIAMAIVGTLLLLTAIPGPGGGSVMDFLNFALIFSTPAQKALFILVVAGIILFAKRIIRSKPQ